MLHNHKKPSVVTPIPKSKKKSLIIKECSPFDYTRSKTSPFIDKNEETPTINLSHVLASIKASPKGSLSSPLQISQDEESTLCDLKTPGDLSLLNISSGYSFRDPQSDGEDYLSPPEDEAHEEPDSPKPEVTANDGPEDLCQTEEEGLNLSFELLFTKLEIEKERKLEVEMNIRERCESYKETLTRIRQSVNHQAQQRWNEDQRLLLDQHVKAEDSFYASSENISNLEKKYIEESEKHWQLLQNEIATISAKEAEEAAKHMLALTELKQLLDLFIATHENMKPFLGNAAMLESFDATILKAKEAFEKANTQSYNVLQLVSLKKQLSAGLAVLSSVQLPDDSKNQGESSQSPIQTAVSSPTIQPPSHVTPSLNSSTIQDPQAEIQSPRLSQNHPPTPTPVPQSSSSSSLLIFYQKRFKDLQQKAAKTSELAAATKTDMNLRPLLSRGIGVVNQLNNVAHDSSNRSKLQHIFNMISGRTFTVGEQACSIKSNSSAVAFVNDQLALNIITLAHDRQVNSMAIYASLILRIWLSYPDVGDLILFRLYEACPFLVPLTVKRTQLQTDEEYHRSLGMRHKEGCEREGIDKYLTRMGALAQLYGRIVAMDMKDKHPHGLEEGWKWLARVLTLPPYPSVTAALLNGFLTTAGHVLLNTYGAQFRKLLYFITTNYVPLLAKETLEGGTSDLESLKRFLEDFHKTNRIPPPDPSNNLIL